MKPASREDFGGNRDFHPGTDWRQKGVRVIPTGNDSQATLGATEKQLCSGWLALALTYVSPRSEPHRRGRGWPAFKVQGA